jgi:hypothetical protein
VSTGGGAYFAEGGANGADGEAANNMYGAGGSGWDTVSQVLCCGQFRVVGCLFQLYCLGGLYVLTVNGRRPLIGCDGTVGRFCFVVAVVVVVVVVVACSSSISSIFFSAGTSVRRVQH